MLFIEYLMSEDGFKPWGKPELTCERQDPFVGAGMPVPPFFQYRP